MKRRNAVKNLGLAFAGLVSLPGWAQGWTPETVGQPVNASCSEEYQLGEIVETIIPQTETPGARALQVHLFVLRMIQDCYGEPEQELLKQGLLETEQQARQMFGKSFIDCAPAQRNQVLTLMSQSAEGLGRRFVDMIKSLTIRGYMHSEYYLTHIAGFKMAPGFYHGCVPVRS